MKHTIIPLFIAFSLVACEDRQTKTDSMLYREQAIKDAQAPLGRAQRQLTEEVRSNPLDHLDSLVVVNNAIKEAQQVYSKSNLMGIDDPLLEEMTVYISHLTPALTGHAKMLLNTLVDRTVELRKQIEDAKNRPYSARNTKTEGLVEFLGQAYNEEVKKCCLDSLSRIDQLLQNNPSKHRDLLVLIRSINNELGNVIKTESYAGKLKRRIAEL